MQYKLCRQVKDNMCVLRKRKNYVVFNQENRKYATDQIYKILTVIIADRNGNPVYVSDFSTIRRIQ